MKIQSFKKRVHVVFAFYFLLFVLCTISCKKSAMQEGGVSKTKGAVLTDVGWVKNNGEFNATVCFGTKKDIPNDENIRDQYLWDMPLSASTQKYIKEIILNEFERVKRYTNISFNFNGWGDCDSQTSNTIFFTKTVDERIYGLSSTIGRNELSYQNAKESTSTDLVLGKITKTLFKTDYVPKSLKKAPYSVIFINEEDVSKEKGELFYKFSIQDTALHEMLHTLGFFHGHAFPEAKNDLNCIKYANDNNIDINALTTTSDMISRNPTIRTAYDPYSITNYCWLYAMEQKVLVNQASLANLHLSLCDLNLLNQLYGTEKKVLLRNCSSMVILEDKLQSLEEPDISKTKSLNDKTMDDSPILDQQTDSPIDPNPQIIPETNVQNTEEP